MNHPLIRALRRIIRQHRLEGRRVRSDKMATPRVHAQLRAFFDGISALHDMSADLIEDALKQYPLSGRGSAGAAPIPSRRKKGGRR